MKDSAHQDTASLETAISLRPASADDDAFLYDVYASTRREEFAVMNLPEAQMEMIMKLQFKAQSGAYSQEFHGADNEIILFNDQPVGRMLVNRTGNDLLLVDIALLPDYRSKGIGELLIRGLQEEAKKGGMPVKLSVVKTNRAARLYERLGFSAIGEDGIRFHMIWRSGDDS